MVNVFTPAVDMSMFSPVALPIVPWLLSELFTLHRKALVRVMPGAPWVTSMLMVQVPAFQAVPAETRIWFQYAAMLLALGSICPP